MADLMTTERVIPTTASPPQTDSTGEADPYFYGWRNVSHTLPNGKQVWQRVPLTLQDILYPLEGDFRVHSDEHQRFCDYLYDVFNVRMDSPSAIVLHDVRVDWNVPDVKPNGPDIAVMLGVKKRKDWGTFEVKEESATPLLVIEVTSPTTRKFDLNEKVSEYQQAGVEYYVIVDRAKGKKRQKRRVLGYHFTPFGSATMKTNDLGWLWLEPVNLWLGFRGRQLVCVDESGKLIPDHKGTVAKLKKAEVRAEVERTLRLAAETKAQTAEAQVEAVETKAEEERTQRLAAEAQVEAAEVKAEAAEAKAEAAEAKAEAERTQRLAMEEELARLRAKFASLSNQTEAGEQGDD